MSGVTRASAGGIVRTRDRLVRAENMGTCVCLGISKIREREGEREEECVCVGGGAAGSGDGEVEGRRERGEEKREEKRREGGWVKNVSSNVEGRAWKVDRSVGVELCKGCGVR